ncbi:MAG: Calx-beta domain-containing protein [Verrucomicrobiota bacterium]
MKPLVSSLAVAALFTGLASIHSFGQAVLFSDDFETDTSADWAVFSGSTSGTPDFTAQFAFDYSQQQFVSNGETKTIPPAPNSGTGPATRGVKVTVNKNDDIAEMAAMNLYLKNKNFSGNYTLKFDMWINYNGPAFGGTGSTEFGIFGINFIGDKVNWSGSTDSDGAWFAVTGEGGASRDYRVYEGAFGFAPTELQGVDAGFLDRDADGLTEFNVTGAQASTYPLKSMFPAPEYETGGVPGKHWVEVEVRQRDGFVTWLINGYVIASRTFPWTEGTIMLGTMDPFDSLASPKEDNYVIFDNVRVIDLGSSTPLPEVGIEAGDAEAAEPELGTNTANFRIFRTGDMSAALTVNYRVAGTATAGTDYTTLTGTATIPAGAPETDVVVTPLNDEKGEPTETVWVTLAGSNNFDIGTGVLSKVDILDDGDVTSVSITASDANMYERIPEDQATFTVTRLGDLSTDLTVNLTFGGTATSGVDYEGASATVTILATEASAQFSLTPKDDNALESDETIDVSVAAGDGYVPGTPSSASATIKENDLPDATVLFSDTFDTDTSPNWNIKFAAGNNIPDYRAQFAYDYSQDGIPPAPNSQGGTTTGLKVTVNKDDGTAGGAAGVNLYPAGLNLSGNYAVRFDMFFSVGTDVGGTTEHAIFGINHSGTLTNRHNQAGSDGLWFAVDGDGSNNRAYASYVATSPTTTPTVTIKTAPEFAAFFTRPPYFSPDTAGAPSSNPLSDNKIWVDVELSQVGNVVTWKINRVTIFERENTFGFTSGNFMLGYNDQFNSIGSQNNYVIYDNVRVVRLAGGEPPVINISRIESLPGNQARITFTATNGSATQFKLESASAVTGPYSDDPAAVQSTGAGQFQATATVTGNTRFFRIKF